MPEPREMTIPNAKEHFNGVGAERFNPSREHGTCKWCGRKLRKARYVETPTRIGDYGDGSFCGLRCGYMFGLTFVINGMRLNKK